jgi:hypothetical protein
VGKPHRDWRKTMNVTIESEAEIMQEVSELLLQKMSPAKVARFWASWQVGRGDYLQWREATFADETVDSLYEQIKAFQESNDSEQ